ncbi:MAG TPA: cupin domain-containing protein [Candidatus Eisenbacteria bacterium]|nr:cupin domain-containing protein [Candidatus Eisenbacteria bacterium]
MGKREMKPCVVSPGGGRFVPVGSTGAGVTVKVSDAETDGLCTVWEGRVGPGTVGAGPHYHRGRDEFFYVLEGELVLRIGDETHTARAGTFAFVPRGTIHGFRNASGESATLLVMHHPAGFERYFEEMQPLAARHGSREERAALAERYDMFPAPEHPEA